MAQHSIKIGLPKASLLNSDAVIKVRASGKLLGTLTVSRGNLEWFSSRWRIPTKLNWEQFDRLMHREWKRPRRNGK
jgi:hypothetical protein